MGIKAQNYSHKILYLSFSKHITLIANITYLVSASLNGSIGHFSAVPVDSKPWAPNKV